MSVELKMDESGGELQPSEADSLFHVKPSKLSEENIDSELNTIMDDAEANNVNSTSEAANGLQLVEELLQQGTEAEVGKVATSPDVNIVLEAIKLENATLAEPVTSVPQLVEEVHQQGNETGNSALPTELSEKAFDFVATISEHDDILKDLPQQESETELAVPSDEVTKNLIAAEVSGVEIIVLLDHETTGLQIVEGLHQQDSEAKSSDEIIVASVKATANKDEDENTISSEKASIAPHLVVDLSQWEDETEPAFLGKNSIPVVETEVQVSNSDDKMDLNLIHYEKTTEITEELESLNRQMDCKLKKIDEIAKQEVAIDKAITDMEYQCSKFKCRHADYIEFYKFIVESRLPLHNHRDIKLMMKKKDKEAQKFLFKSFDLQLKIEAQAKLKLTLQEERKELAKQVEALKLQTDQKLKEAAESDSTGLEPQCSESELRQTYCKKRKTPNKSQVQAKRLAVDTAGSSQECNPR